MPECSSVLHKVPLALPIPWLVPTALARGIADEHVSARQKSHKTLRRLRGGLYQPREGLRQLPKCLHQLHVMFRHLLKKLLHLQKRLLRIRRRLPPFKRSLRQPCSSPHQPPKRPPHQCKAASQVRNLRGCYNARTCGIYFADSFSNSSGRQRKWKSEKYSGCETG